MSDASKQRSSSSSSSSGTSKTRKSKNEVIRSTLGIYLKQRNYSPTERFRKSDFTISQSRVETQFNMLMADDVARVNSFMYSNVLCLNKNPGLVEQQFGKFVTFIQAQTGPVKTELQTVISPMLCYLFIEMLKGKDSQPPIDFLKKVAHLVGPVDSLTAALPTKLNGRSVAVAPPAEQPAPAPAPPARVPSGTTQITFLREPENANTKDYFQELVQALSVCRHIEELEMRLITRNFRYGKHEVALSMRAVYALKHFLIENGHVMIMHILQTWFSVDITDMHDTVKPGDNEPMVVDKKKDPDSVFKKPFPAAGSVKPSPPRVAPPTHVASKKFQALRSCVLRLKKYEWPMRVFNVLNADNRLCSADLDPMQCHLAAGFDDSTVKLWQIDRSTTNGRKPFMNRPQRCCEWSLDHDCLELSSTDEDSDEEPTASHTQMPRARRKRTGNDQMRPVDGETYSEHLLMDFGENTLRGHSKGVTGVLFSRQQSLLFSVSKDTTMRAWTSSNYLSAAVYRGHNYPIWCVAESSSGTYLATGSKDRTARLWSTDREFPLQTYIGHTLDVDAIAFHPNGNYIATGSTDLTVRLWCVTSGKLFRVFTDSHLPVHCVSFSPDGKLLASAGEEAKIRIFDLAAGSQLTELKDHSAPVTGIAWNAHGTRLASCCADGTMRTFNVRTANVQKPTVVKPAASSAATPSSSSSSATARSTSTTKSNVVSSLTLLSSSIKPTSTSASGCKRCVKTFFNASGYVSCIGNS